MNEQTVSRRGVLRGVAGGLLVAPGVGHVSLAELGQRPPRGRESATSTGGTTVDGGGATAAPTVTVMTWNLYVGTDLRRLLVGSDGEEMEAAVAELLTDVERSRFDARAEAVADAIATNRPDLVGLQEVTLLRLQLPGDYVADPGRTNAGGQHLDFLELLQEKLVDRGLSYDVAGAISNTDVELPARLDAGVADVRFTDRDVILARRGLETGATTRQTYDATVTVPLPDGVEFPLTRGYCAIDVEHEGTAFTFVNTHLDSVSAATQLDQARELVVDLTALDRPVVLVGDFNSPADGSETVTYDLLTQFFTDTHTAVLPDDPGYTCCQQPDLQNPASNLTKRLDLVLVRGVGPATAVDRVGADADDRVSTVVGGERRRLWPSDHAGVVATVRLHPEEATAQRATGVAPSESAIEGGNGAGSSSDGQRVGGDDVVSDDAIGGETVGETTETTGVDAPGFGVVAGVLALGAVGVGLLRRRRARASESTRFSRSPEK